MRHSLRGLRPPALTRAPPGLDVPVEVNGPGADYTAAAPTTLTFLPGQTSKAVSVQVKGGLAREANKTFSVNLSADATI